MAQVITRDGVHCDMQGCPCMLHASDVPDAPWALSSIGALRARGWLVLWWRGPSGVNRRMEACPSCAAAVAWLLDESRWIPC